MGGKKRRKEKGDWEENERDTADDVRKSDWLDHNE